jgi:hypothetical protein
MSGSDREPVQDGVFVAGMKTVTATNWDAFPVYTRPDSTQQTSVAKESDPKIGQLNELIKAINEVEPFKSMCWTVGLSEITPSSRTVGLHIEVDSRQIELMQVSIEGLIGKIAQSGSAAEAENLMNNLVTTIFGMVMRRNILLNESLELFPTTETNKLTTAFDFINVLFAKVGWTFKIGSNRVSDADFTEDKRDIRGLWIVSSSGQVVSLGTIQTPIIAELEERSQDNVLVLTKNIVTEVLANLLQTKK